MLSRNAKRVLKHLKSHGGQRMAYQDIMRNLSWEFAEVKSACHQLILAGLAAEYEYVPMPGGGSKSWGVFLTEEGRNSRQYFWLKVAEGLIKSVIVPIAVSVLTTLVTLWVLNALG